MSAKDVFISYKAEEFEEANWLKNVLESNGICCWMAPSSIPGGSNYAQEIPEAIAQCKVFVLVLSRRAQESMWISKELNQALNEHKVIMPFMLEDCPLHKEFNFYLSDVQRYDAFRSKSDAVKKMVTEIRAIIAGAADTQSSAQQEPSVHVPKAQPKPLPALVYWIFVTWMTCIPAGLVTTAFYLLGRRSEPLLKATKFLCILCTIGGIFLFLFATGNYSHYSEAMYLSVVGLIFELAMGHF